MLIPGSNLFRADDQGTTLPQYSEGNSWLFRPGSEGRTTDELRCREAILVVRHTELDG